MDHMTITTSLSGTICSECAGTSYGSAVYRIWNLYVHSLRRYERRQKMQKLGWFLPRGICCRRVSVCLSVCVCVFVSVTLRYCINTAKRRIMQITPHDSPVTLVFWHQSSWQNSNGITPYGGDKCRWGGLKFATFDEKSAITRKRYKIDA